MDQSVPNNVTGRMGRTARAWIVTCGVCAGLFGGSYAAWSAMTVHDPTSFVTQVQQLSSLADQLGKMEEQVNQAQRLNNTMGSQGFMAVRAISGLADKIGRIADGFGVDLGGIEMPGGDKMNGVITSQQQAKDFITEALYSAEVRDLEAKGEGGLEGRLAGRGMSHSELIEDRERARKARQKLVKVLADSALSNGLAGKGETKASAERLSDLSAAVTTSDTLRSQIAAQNEIQLAVLAELVKLNGLISDKVALDGARVVQDSAKINVRASKGHLPEALK